MRNNEFNAKYRIFDMPGGHPRAEVQKRLAL